MRQKYDPAGKAVAVDTAVPWAGLTGIMLNKRSPSYTV